MESYKTEILLGLSSAITKPKRQFFTFGGFRAMLFCMTPKQCQMGERPDTTF